MYSNNNYNKKLKQAARQLRTNSVSKAEKYIWKNLLSKKQLGVKFLRQRPIDKFIVDFFSPDINLIIEIDGSSHSCKSEYDFERQNKLEEMGYKVIRFSEGEVLNDIEKIKYSLDFTIRAMMSPT